MTVDVWIAALFGAGVALLLIAWGLHRRRPPEPGAPESPVVEDDTTPLEGPIAEAALALTMCPHDVPLSRHCERCDGVLRGKHVTLDDDEPKGSA